VLEPGLRAPTHLHTPWRPGRPPPAAEPAGEKRPCVKIAYLILVHSRDSVLASQLLIKAIWRPDFFYLYIIDKNMERDARSLLESIAEVSFHNVQIMTASVESEWGSLGVIQSELDGLQELLTYGQWDYAINLSGDSYPIMSQDGLVARLAEWQGANFMTDTGEEPITTQYMPSRKADTVKWPRGITTADYFGSQVRVGLAPPECIAVPPMSRSHMLCPTVVCSHA
jgi:hypothetical protein